MTKAEYRLQLLAERKRNGEIRMQYRNRVRPSKIAWWWNLGQVPNHLDMAIAAFRYGQEACKRGACGVRVKIEQADFA